MIPDNGNVVLVMYAEAEAEVVRASDTVDNVVLIEDGE